MDGVDAGDRFEVDADFAVQGEDEVGQVVAGGPQEDRALERFGEQRGVGLDVAVDGALGAPGAVARAGGELHAGADRADVGLVEEGRVRQAQDEARRCWRRLTGAGRRRAAWGARPCGCRP